MKVGIITVFDAVNYGSYLQAFCLQEVLKSMGQEVFMIKTSSPLYAKWRFTSLFTYHPKKMKFKAKLAKGYFKLWKQFKVIKNPKDLDLLVVGSDEMWELKNVTMTPLPIFFGVGISAKRKATYAVSSNSTEKGDVEKYSFAVEGVKSFDYISVRDQSTYNAYCDLVNNKPVFSVDPTLLVDLEEYAVECKKSNYILCYTYTFQSYMIDAVKKLAAKLGKKIIVVGQNFSWADECIPATAFEFLGLIMKADFIVTDTFHGATLSIGLKKQFVAFAYKTKVFRALELFGLLDRNVNEKNVLLDSYEKQINYNEIYSSNITPIVNESKQYLRKILED